jgi:integrase
MPIETRHRTYFAYLDVPEDVRARLGRRVFRQTLQTDSRSVAERRAPPMIARWKAEIATARGQPGTDDAAFWRDALRRATTDKGRTLVLEQIEATAASIGADHVDLGHLPSTAPEARTFYAEATGARVPTVEHLGEWIGSLQVKDKTAAMRKAAVERLGGTLRMVHEVTRPEVRRWVTGLSPALKSATVQRIVSDCRGYWRYLATIEVVPEDSAPFDRLGLKAKRTSWQQFDPADVVRLLRAAVARGDGQLADLIRLAMYSGARREELCALRVADVASDRFTITEAKTSAGVRTVPIHTELAGVLARLTKTSRDGYVLSGLTANRNGDRGDALGKRFTRHKQALGFDGLHVFHSLRGTFITMLERAGVPEGTVQDLVGHERSTLTGNTYSGKSTFEMRRDALALLAYPAAGRPARRGSRGKGR